ncbi:MAG: hypothetical protein ACJASQ_003680 [Crocinitomicaceae bacterium]
MKRLLSTYISVVLLLCLVIQVAPLSLLHSHEDHLTEVEHDTNSMDDADADYIDETNHDSAENECNVCKIQQSLNNQTYTLGEQDSIFNFYGQSSVSLNLEASIDDHLIKSTSGRGPPFA